MSPDCTQVLKSLRLIQENTHSLDLVAAAAAAGTVKGLLAETYNLSGNQDCRCVYVFVWNKKPAASSEITLSASPPTAIFLK